VIFIVALCHRKCRKIVKKIVHWTDIVYLLARQRWRTKFLC